jgi:NADPH:quinone reductase
MQALLCTRFGPVDGLELREIPPPVAGPGEVVVAIRAASLNFPDVLIIENKYQFKPPLPFSPGSELAGVVEQIGPGVSGVAIGDRVMAFTIHGALADAICLPVSAVLPIPPAMDFQTAAALLVTYGTMDHALRDRGGVTSGDTVLVLGASGGIGLASIEIANALGARVIACASSDDKLAVCRQHGADAVINYDVEDLRERIKALTDGQGVTVVCDPVGGRYTEPALRSLAWRGRLLVIGFAAGDIPRIPLNLTLLKGCAIIGVFWGDFVRREPAAFRASVAQLARWYEDGRLHPHVSAVYPLNRAVEALQLIAARKAVGKIVVTMGKGVGSI